jgi:hypothetical protein
MNTRLCANNYFFGLPVYVLENPVLQRELLVNLRMTRAFLLLFCYLAVLGGVV